MNFMNFSCLIFSNLKCYNTPQSKNIPGGKICPSGKNVLIPPICILFSNGPRSLPKNSPYCTIIDS